MAEVVKFPSPVTPQFRRLPQVLKATGLAASTLYDRVSDGLFPKPVKISKRSTAWPEHEVSAINRAIVAGRSDAEIRQLVRDLVSQRTVAEGQ